MYVPREKAAKALLWVLYWTATNCCYKLLRFALMLFLTAIIDSKQVPRLAVVLFLTAKYY